MDLSIWCRTFMHIWEKEVFFLSAVKFFLAPAPQEGPFQVMFAETQHTEQQNEHMRAQESRCYENKLCLRRFTHPILLVSDDDVR